MAIRRPSCIAVSSLTPVFTLARFSSIPLAWKSAVLVILHTPNLFLPGSSLFYYDTYLLHHSLNQLCGLAIALEFSPIYDFVIFSFLVYLPSLFLPPSPFLTKWFGDMFGGSFGHLYREFPIGAIFWFLPPLCLFYPAVYCFWAAYSIHNDLCWLRIIKTLHWAQPILFCRTIFTIFGAPGITTGVSTPHCASSHRAFILSHKPVEYTLLIPTTLRYHAAELHQRFASELPSRTNEFVLSQEPYSIPEPLSWFLGSWHSRLQKGKMKHGNPRGKFHGFYSLNSKPVFCGAMEFKLPFNFLVFRPRCCRGPSLRRWSLLLRITRQLHRLA